MRLEWRSASRETALLFTLRIAAAMDQGNDDIATFHFALWLAVLCVIAYFAAISSAHAAEINSAKRALIISTGSRFSAGFAVAHERERARS